MNSFCEIHKIYFVVLNWYNIPSLNVLKLIIDYQRFVFEFGNYKISGFRTGLPDCTVALSSPDEEV